MSSQWELIEHLSHPTILNGDVHLTAACASVVAGRAAVAYYPCRWIDRTYYSCWYLRNGR